MKYSEMKDMAYEYFILRSKFEDGVMTMADGRRFLEIIKKLLTWTGVEDE